MAQRALQSTKVKHATSVCVCVCVESLFALIMAIQIPQHNSNFQLLFVIIHANRRVLLKCAICFYAVPQSWFLFLVLFCLIPVYVFFSLFFSLPTIWDQIEPYIALDRQIEKEKERMCARVNKLIPMCMQICTIANWSVPFAKQYTMRIIHLAIRSNELCQRCITWKMSAVQMTFSPQFSRRLTATWHTHTHWR